MRCRVIDRVKHLCGYSVLSFVNACVHMFLYKRKVLSNVGNLTYISASFCRSNHLIEMQMIGNIFASGKKREEKRVWLSCLVEIS